MISIIASLLFPPRRSALPQIDDEILTTAALKLSDKIKSGELTSEQVVKSFIQRIRLVNPIINAVVDARFEKAIDEAREIDRRLDVARNGQGDKSILKLPLVGIPFTVKETVSLEGSSFSAGLPKRKLKRAPRSNKAVDQLIKAGLIPIGSTNTPCMNMWWDSDNLVYGRTENPYDLSRLVGGSSGGEAAIQAAAGSVVGVGSDIGGSIRIPCNFCGIFGHKPTPFTVPIDELYPAMRKDQEKLRGVGPMTRYACDLLPMLKIMIDQEEASKMRLDEPVDLSQIKIYYLEDLGDPLSASCDSDILAGFRAAVEHLSSICKMERKCVKLDEFKYGMSLWIAELVVKDGHLFAPEQENGREQFNPLVELAKKIFGKSEFPINIIFLGFFELFEPSYSSFVHRFLTGKASELRERFQNLVGNDGVLLMPTHPQPAPHHQTTPLKIFNCAYTAVGNTLQAPITQCPLGMSREGLPFGLQVISKPYNDRLTLAVAQELEKAFGGWLPPSRIKL